MHNFMKELKRFNDILEDSLTFSYFKGQRLYTKPIFLNFLQLPCKWIYTQIIIGVYLLLILRMAKHYYVTLHGLEKKLILCTFTVLIYFKKIIFTFTLIN
jgi:hypothetical protein